MTYHPHMELDPRLVHFAESIRIRFGPTVLVENNKLTVGLAPNCVLLYKDEASNCICISFHRECHPINVSQVTAVLSDLFPFREIVFLPCHISDVRGVLISESEPGFDLVHTQYLKDLLGIKSKDTYKA